MIKSSIPMETIIGLAIIVVGIACVGFINPTLSKIFSVLLLGTFICFIAMVCKEEYELKKK